MIARVGLPENARMIAWGIASTALVAALVAPSGAWAQTVPNAAPAANGQTPGGSAEAGQTDSAPLSAISQQPSLPTGSAIGAAGSNTGAEIVVTGSRIRGVGAVGQNVISVDRGDIIKAGAQTTGDLLRQVPQVVNLGADESHGGAQNGTANVTSGTGINLRGIGPAATLVLLNGRRLPNSGTQGQFTDPSVIPTIAVQRVEVVADGASAIYGSDAVAGVVNFILRNDYQGLETDARYGFGDGYSEYQVSALGGVHWASGHAMLAYERTYHSSLSGDSRDFHTSDLLSQGGHDYRSMQCSPGTLTVSGVNYAVPPTYPFTASSLVAGSSNRCDLVRYADILPRQTRDSVIGNASQEVTSNITLFADGYYSKRRFSSALGPNAGAYTVPSTNPFFVNTGTGAKTEGVGYNFGNQIPYRVSSGYSQSYDVTGGVTVKLPHDWRVEGTTSYGRDDEVDKQTRVRAFTLTPALASTDPATALNLFGGPNNSATLASLNGTFEPLGHLTLQDNNVKLDGPLFDLPGGKVRIAVGGEYRQEFLASGLLSNLNTGTITGSEPSARRHVWSGFAELYVPLVGPDNAMPGINKLDLSVAARWDHYSDVGGTTNPKVGITWWPVSDFQLRGSYGKSFHAPSLYQTGSPVTIYPTTYPDPQSASGFSNGVYTGGGNLNLKPEKATTWSLGGEYKPHFAPRLTVGLTYFSIDYRQQLFALAADNTVLQKGSLYAPYITRNPSTAQVAALLASGSLAGVLPSPLQFIIQGVSENGGKTLARGFDLEANYQIETAKTGTFSLGFNGTYFTKFDTSVAAGLPLVDVLNQINNPLRFRARGSLGWALGNVNAIAFLNYSNPYDNNTVVPVQRVSSYATMDLHVEYRLPDRGVSVLHGLALSVDARNLFNRDPQFVDITGGYDPQVAAALGRVISFTVRKTW